mmetsp:Transcript_26319/g.80994  ORF Transcript_26319/g.80994 Transcript_26319/m.80994 type:complete len:231 (+) Transcript_26319:289-981(+)
MRCEKPWTGTRAWPVVHCSSSARRAGLMSRSASQNHCTTGCSAPRRLNAPWYFVCSIHSSTSIVGVPESMSAKSRDDTSKNSSGGTTAYTPRTNASTLRFVVCSSAPSSRSATNSCLFSSVTALSAPPGTSSRVATSPSTSESTANVSARSVTSISVNCFSDRQSWTSRSCKSSSPSGAPQTCFSSTWLISASRCVPSNRALATSRPEKLSHARPAAPCEAATAASSQTV